MNKATEISAKLENLEIAEGMKVIEACYEDALHFDVIDDTMCVMHSDGSVNIIEHMGAGGVTVEVISAANILKVLHHYRPFKDVFKGGVQ